MERKENLSKFSQFWLIPFLTGSLFAIGYVITNKTFVQKSQLQQSKHRLLLKKAGFKEDFRGSQKTILSEKNDPYQEETLPLNSNGIEPKDNLPSPLPDTAKITTSSEKLPIETSVSKLKDGSSNIESGLERDKRIFQKLFESLPEP